MSPKSKSADKAYGGRECWGAKKNRKQNNNRAKERQQRYKKTNAAFKL